MLRPGSTDQSQQTGLLWEGQSLKWSVLENHWNSYTEMKKTIILNLTHTVTSWIVFKENRYFYSAPFYKLSLKKYEST